MAMKVKTQESLQNLVTTRVVSDSIIGTTHKVNEDKNLVLISGEYAVFAVFDGVGSAKNNKIATQIASDFINENHACYYSDGDFRLDNMIFDLNKVILAHPEAESSALATCAICVLLFEVSTLLYLNLGDSRVYTVGKHHATRITKDDVAFPGSNIITKCIGTELSYGDVYHFKIKDFKDDLLICSDGFYKLFEDAKLDFFEVLLKRSTATIKSKLQNLIADKNRDDASYVLFKNV